MSKRLTSAAEPWTTFSSSSSKNEDFNFDKLPQMNRKPSKPYVSVRSFEKIISETPFKKYEVKTITLLINSRSKSNPTTISSDEDTQNSLQ